MKFVKNVIFLSIVLAVSMFAGCKDEYPPYTGSLVKVGDGVPAFTVDGPGGTFSSSEFYGKKSLLMFFVTTCGDCQRVFPVINSVWNELKGDEDFMFVLISRQEAAQTVATYWTQQSYTMPYYLDTNRSAYSLFADKTVPRVYLIDTNGYISWMAVEALHMNAEQLIAKMRALR